MKVVILAGGLGTRMGPDDGRPPKPLAPIGGRPILWHVMKIFAAQGHAEFVICTGHRGEEIRRHVAEFSMPGADSSSWRVNVVDTGAGTMTGGRLKRAAAHLGAAPFLLTYADGLADIDLAKLLAHHRKADALVTLSAVHPPPRYGIVEFAPDGERVVAFREKADGDRYINGGFMVVEPDALALIEGDDTSWESGALERLARTGRLAAYRHEGFWSSMDTPRDLARLDELWESGRAPWKIW